MLRQRISRGPLILFLLLLLVVASSACINIFGSSFFLAGAGGAAFPGTWAGIYGVFLGGVLVVGGIAFYRTLHLNRSVLESCESIARSLQKMEKSPQEGGRSSRDSEAWDRLDVAANSLAARLQAACGDSGGQLRDLDPRYRVVFEALPSPFFLTGRDGVIESCNPAAAALLSHLGLDGRLPPAVQRLVEAARHQELDYLPDSPAEAVYIRTGEKECYYLPRIFRLKNAAADVAVMLIDVTRLRWLDDLKTSQIATVSHEIKTPLTAIRVMLHLLLEKKFGGLNSNQEDMMRTACGDCERLLRTLNQLLEFSRLEAGAEQLHFTPEKPGELAGLAVGAASEIASLRGIRMELETSPDCPEVRVDASRIGHVLGNFLSNAVKFSPAGSVVRVRTAEGPPGFVRFSVIDQGSGIGEEFRTRIFERFFRLPGSDGEGVGLGLSIASEIVRAHQGRIGVVPAPGQGSEFYCEIPVAGRGSGVPG